MTDSDAIWRENLQNAWAALRMIRETVETLGPPGILISEEEVLAQYGPEPIHEATAIVAALTTLLGWTVQAAEKARQRVESYIFIGQNSVIQMGRKDR
ncbi:hypothetical protein FXV83_29885 [Bradyrhizobium hipponense]|uniref:Uncharacterized protein n=1 Tax=Bradyrhizobium hipponense TaxID=2605638 RepID=A0A5S4YG25_9BRAD|nr:hypothetical protein [Bradyrhizobium hipponense]TYO62972.1 hypothetical protein FXV83_29885 [Bradyrhizobium hipponense]